MITLETHIRGFRWRGVQQALPIDFRITSQVGLIRLCFSLIFGTKMPGLNERFVVDFELKAG